MRKDFGAKAILYPMPVLIIGTYDENQLPDAMNAAWGGICNDTRISICLSSDHKTVKNLLKTKAFTVSVADLEHVKACDYVGIVSGNIENEKVFKAGFTTTKSKFVNAPIINELPLTLECSVVQYDEKNELLIGEIVNVSASYSILDEKGKIDVEKLNPITFDPVNHKYIKLGAVVADAFKIGLEIKNS